MAEIPLTMGPRNSTLFLLITLSKNSSYASNVPFKHTSAKNDKRPLAKGLSIIELKDMIKKRSKHYKQANHRIFCEGLSKREIADRIIKKYENQ